MGKHFQVPSNRLTIQNNIDEIISTKMVETHNKQQIIQGTENGHDQSTIKLYYTSNDPYH